MKIMTINKEKCTQCSICIAECPANLFSTNGSKAVYHKDPVGWCIGCGHCIAVCPENAIEYEAHEQAKNIPGKSMQFDDVAGLLLGKRTVRQYKKKDIPKEELEKILEVMRYAPSGHNAQPCEYVILKDREMIKMISDLTIKSFKSFRNLMRIRKLLRPFLPKPFYEILESKSTALGIEDMMSRYASGEDVIFFDAPAVILVHVPNMGGLSYIDPAIAVTYGMLAAQALGIGSCWMAFAMMAVEKDKKLLQTLHIPKERFIAGIFTLGYQKNKFQRLPVRNPVKAIWSIGDAV